MAQKNSASLEKQVRGGVKKLTEEGKPITNLTVREAIGGGSFRDIGPMLKSIKAEIAAQQQAARQAPDMPEDFHDAASAMWNTAWSLADEIAASERRAHAVESDKLKAEVQEALENCGQVEDERDEAEARAREAAEQVQALTENLRKAELEIAGLNGQLAARDDAEARADKAAAKAQTLEEALRKAELEIAALSGRLAERDDDIVHRTKGAKAQPVSLASSSEEPGQRDMFADADGKDNPEKAVNATAG
ncbi:MAG: DNA-binding protein [Heliomarina sp.]|uniref:DNA-binding protein n=1 Tax=Heliomarina sp. TaxID=2917556 RepID=UPI0040582B52